MTLVVEVADRQEFVELVRAYISEMRMETVLFWRVSKREESEEEVEVLYIVPFYPADVDWVIWRYREKIRAPANVSDDELDALATTAVEAMLKDIGVSRAVRIRSMTVDGENIGK